ncbi:HXXEE domain-containing protein [bacterium]|nr:HXXEE domain-containing protein [bacterium]
MNPDGKKPARWSWFFPTTLPIHIAEEFWAGEGFLSWNARATGAVFSVAKFFTLVSVGFILVLIGVLLARHYKKMRWIISALATIFLINGFSHLIATLTHSRYSPGLVSGLLLWIPFSIWILIAEHRLTTKLTFFGGVITGAMIHGVVILFSRGIINLG